MRHFWLVFIGVATGMVITAAVVGAFFWWWLGCDGWSIC